MVLDGGRAAWAMQRSLAKARDNAAAVQRGKEIALGFFFDELFAVGGLVGGDDFFR